MADILNELNDTNIHEKGMRKWTGPNYDASNIDEATVSFFEKHPGVFRSMSAAQIQEEIGADAFDSLTLDRMHKHMLKGYKGWEPVWPKLVSNTVKLTDFRTRYAILKGSFDRLDEVTPSGLYREDDFTDDQITYTPKKYGKMFNYTFEASTYDDLGMLDSKAEMLGGAAARTLDYFVLYTLFANEPTSYDGSNDIFDSSTWSNDSTNGALNIANLETNYEALMSQTDLDSNNIVYTPKYLLVPPSSYLTAIKLVGSPDDPSTSNRAKNVLYGKLEVISHPYLDGNYWWLMADPATANTFEVGLWKGSNEPELFYEAANSGHAFDRDAIRTKVRQVFGGSFLDPRCVQRDTLS